MGFLELKGLPEALPASEVVWEPGQDPFAFPFPLELGVEPARPFVSRVAELERAEVVSDPTRDRVAVLWLLGEPGIGKTRLATEIARRAHAAGAVVLFGRCNEDLSVPYQPFLEALRWFVHRVPDDELPERLGFAPGELTRLLPELATRLPGIEASRSTSPQIEQHRLFEAVRSWLAMAGGDRPVLAVLDDVHWATGPPSPFSATWPAAPRRPGPSSCARPATPHPTTTRRSPPWPRSSTGGESPATTWS